MMLHETLNNKLTDQLSIKNAPWQKNEINLPVNPITNKRYKAANMLALMAENKTDPRWLTIDQAKKLGGDLIEGEKGVNLQYWLFSEKDKNGDIVKLERPKSFVCCVYNAEQFENLNLPVFQNKVKNLDAINNIINNLNIEVVNEPNAKAHYDLKSNKIIIGDENSFRNREEYLTTILHEINHATSHPDLLDRKINSNPFGSSEYAKEELVAEIATMIVCSELGLEHNKMAHVSYTNQWASILSNDPTEILRAASEAERIQDLLLSNSQKILLNKANEAEEKFTVNFENITEINNDFSQYNTIQGASEENEIKNEYSEVFKRLVANFHLSETGEFASITNPSLSFKVSKDSLSTKNSDDEIINGMFDIAELKGWSKVIINGTEEFQARALFIANERGIVVEKPIENNKVIDEVFDKSFTEKALEALLDADKKHSDNLDANDSTTDILERLKVNMQNMVNIRKEEAEYSAALNATDKQHTSASVSTLETLDTFEHAMANIQEKEYEAVYEADKKHSDNLEPNDPVIDIIDQLRANMQNMVNIKKEEAGYNAALDLTNKQHTSDPVSTFEMLDAFEQAMTNIQEPLYNEALDPMDALLEPKLAESAKEKTKEYIKVDYGDREEVKALGAKWDKDEKSWYFSEDLDQKLFSKWTEVVLEERPNSNKEEINNDIESTKNVRTYLAVPYLEREEAKALGVKWDKEQKSWYVSDDNKNLLKVEKWLPENQVTEQMPAITPYEEFREVLISYGFDVDSKVSPKDKGKDHPIMDGATHRVRLFDDKEGQFSGFYVGHLDGHPAGYLQNNRTGQSLRWKSESNTLTDKEKASLNAVAAQKLKDRTENLAKLQNSVAEKSAEKIKTMKKVDENLTPYLVSKGIKSQKGIYTDSKNQTTCIPLQDINGSVRSIQYIQKDGTKRFAKDGQKRDCFHVIDGEKIKGDEVLILAEGYATASSIKAATGHKTIATFDSGNLVCVASLIKEKYPDIKIVIAGDDDRHQGEKNPGLKKAMEAAEKTGSKFVLPIFGSNETSKEFNDFNDLATKSSLGISAVRNQINSIVNQINSKEEKVVTKNKGVRHGH